jgi:endo-1,4-beta-xylanase
MAESARVGTVDATVPSEPAGRSGLVPAIPPPFVGPARRWLALGVVAVLLLGGAVSVVRHLVADTRGSGAKAADWQEPLITDRPTLRGLAPSNIRIGTAVDNRMLAENEQYRATVVSDFTAITPENAMKWSVLAPAPDRYEWGTADRLVKFAVANGQAVYGHTLLWHSSIPSWVDESWSPAQLREVLRKHVTTVVSRYRGKVWAWDVVNEVLAENGALRDTLWLRKLGPGYIAEVFRWAHQADPDARLFINDYGTEGRTAKSDGLWRLVSRLRAQGVPVQGVGFQAHLRSDQDPADIAGTLRRFAALGVAVAVTELDVRLKLPVTPEKLTEQALLYQHVLAVCLAVATCESFTVWGFTDASSWIGQQYPGYGAACLFDADMRPKQAHGALVATLRQPRGELPR